VTVGGPGRAGGRRWFALPLTLLLLPAAVACTSEPSTPTAATSESPSPFADCTALLTPPSPTASSAASAPPASAPSVPAPGGSSPSAGGKEPGQGPFKTPPPVGEDAELPPGPAGSGGTVSATLPMATAGSVESAAVVAESTGSATAPAGSALPDISLPCFTGGAPVRLAEVRGPAVINLWASWCEPCRAELPVIQALADKGQGRVHVLGVDVGDSREAAASFAAGRDVSFPTLYDRDRQLLAALGRITLPVTVFLDSAGRTYVHPTPVDARSLSELLRTHTGVAVAP
jgi:cytochrome c biogenesis protein CcmG, thiol:disulfide interchange protein DsbE